MKTIESYSYYAERMSCFKMCQFLLKLFFRYQQKFCKKSNRYVSELKRTLNQLFGILNKFKKIKLYSMNSKFDSSCKNDKRNHEVIILFFSGMYGDKIEF